MMILQQKICFKNKNHAENLLHDPRGNARSFLNPV